MGDRVAWLLKEKGVSAASVAREARCDRSNMTHITQNKTDSISGAILMALVNQTGANPNWIVFGRGKPFPDKNPVDEIYKALESLPSEHKAKVEAEILFLRSLHQDKQS